MKKMDYLKSMIFLIIAVILLICDQEIDATGKLTKIRDDPIESFTVHLMYYKQNKQSEGAKIILIQKLCATFICYTGVKHKADEASIFVSGDVLLTIPNSIIHEVLPWLMQFRIARLNFPAQDNLDIAVHPNTDMGSDYDYQNYLIWGGHYHPYDSNKLYASKYSKNGNYDVLSAEINPAIHETSQDDSDEDLWAYTCSSDASGQGHWVDLCSSPPFAPNTTCRSDMSGAHLHLYYQQNNPKSVEAKEKFKQLASEKFELSLEFCPDKNGHEEPHNEVCWLAGPEGTEAPYPQTGERSSFTTGKISLYVTNERFSELLGWILMNMNQDILGEDLDFILHPCYGCNFADHQMWSLHRGTRVPNNMYGIALSGDWKDSTNPPSIDPLSPINHNFSNLCQSLSPKDIHNYIAHFLYDPTNSNHHLLVEDLKSKFLSDFGDNVQPLHSEDVEFDDIESIFVASDAMFSISVDVIDQVVAWMAKNVPTSKMISVFLQPYTSAGICDLFEYPIWLGEKFPLKTLRASDSIMPQFSEIDKSRQATSHDNEFTANSSVLTSDFLMYIQRAPNNPWQIAAFNNLKKSFVENFDLTEEDCIEQYPNPEPNYNRTSLCMMQEISEPYKNDQDIMTTTYAAVYIPAERLKDVLPWIMLEKSSAMNGYAIDIMLVQLTGNLRVDYLEQSFYSGTKWSLNSGLMMAEQKFNSQKKEPKSYQNDPHWPDLSPSVRYYKEENVDSTEIDPETGIIFKQWITSDSDQGDWTVHPPFITSMTIPPNTKTSGNWEYFWLPADAYYVVIEGTLAFGNVEDKVFEYGDVFWVLGGEVIGPMINSNNFTTLVLIMSTSPIVPYPGSDGIPSDDNPSVDPNLIRTRTYRQNGDGGNWRNNPSPHSQDCIRNGGVQNMGFGPNQNTPAVLRVRWSPSCQIPYHYHPTGALYFIQYGKMYFEGDGPVPDVALNKGEVRWVRPGFAYGPEYNSNDEGMQITVLGTESPPTFHDAPAGPYKMQKEFVITHIYDEL